MTFITYMTSINNMTYINHNHISYLDYKNTPYIKS